MKKQYVEGYGRKKDIKEKLGMASIVGICVLAFAVTAVAGILLLSYDEGEDTENIMVSTAKEDIEVVTEQEEIIEETLSEQEHPETSTKFRPPCAGNVIKEYSVEMPIYSETLDDWRIHEGVDIGAPLGTPVCACADGVIKDKYDDFRYGATVVIEHEGNLATVYSNLENTHLVDIGQAVVAGEKIGKIGDTTLFETVADTHIHVEVLLGGSHVSPLDYFEVDSEQQ